MASNLLRVVGRQGAQMSQRAALVASARSSSSVPSLPDTTQLSLDQRRKMYPRIGDRDIVGPGFQGNPVYEDRHEYPYPSIRFMENTSDVLALREKEKGDWNNLSMEDKKALYRASFRQTFSEFTASRGEWRSIAAGMFLGLAVTGWIIIWMKSAVYSPMPHTISDEWRQAQLELMIAQNQGPVEGVSSKWDYEKGQWKQ